MSDKTATTARGAAPRNAKKPATAAPPRLPDWWPREGAIYREGCFVVRLPSDSKARIEQSARDLGVEIADLASRPLAQVVVALLGEIEREAERLRGPMSAIDAEDERLIAELERRRAERLDRARQLASAGVPA